MLMFAGPFRKLKKGSRCASCRSAVTLQGSVGRYRVTLSTFDMGTFDDVVYTYVSPADLGLDY